MMRDFAVGLGVGMTLVVLFTISTFSIAGIPQPKVVSQLESTTICFVECIYNKNNSTGNAIEFAFVMVILVMLLFSMCALFLTWPLRGAYKENRYLLYAATDIFFLIIFLTITRVFTRDTVNQIIVQNAVTSMGQMAISLVLGLLVLFPTFRYIKREKRRARVQQSILNRPRSPA